MAATAGRAGVAGGVAAGVALGVGELVGGVLGSAAGSAVTLLGSVGDWFIDGPGRGLGAIAVSLFGSSSKPVLVGSMVVVIIGLGALVGRRTPVGGRAGRRPQLPTVAFGGAAAAGALAAVTVGGAAAWVAVVAAVAAALTGLATLRLLLRVAGGGMPLGLTTARAMATADLAGAERRRFLVWSAALGVGGLLAAAVGRAFGGTSAAEQARATVRLPAAVTTPGASRVGAVGTELGATGLSPLITPNRDFYRIDTALVLPDVDPATWSLRVDGLVDRPFTLTFDELLALPMEEHVVTLACVSNPVGGSLVGTAVWQGVPLATLLERAGVRPGAEQLVGRSVDGFTVGFPTAAATDGRVALVAVGMNGEPLPVRNGFPARLVVSGLYGYVSATKWLSSIELTTWDAFDAYWIPRGWAREAPVRTQSRIDVPANGADLQPGPVTVAGVAWAPDVGITAVEVQVDDEPWRPADLSEPLADDAWRQWRIEWNATPGMHRLRVRATDGTGATQPEGPRPVMPDGAEGWHTRRVNVSN